MITLFFIGLGITLGNIKAQGKINHNFQNSDIKNFRSNTGMVVDNWVTGDKLIKQRQPSAKESIAINQNHLSNNSGILMNYSVSGHQLAFSSKELILANSKQMLNIKFEDAREVVPKSEQNFSSLNNSKTSKDFNKVVYSNLWNGITLVYESTRDGILKSNYIVDFGIQGVTVNSICLSYNRPVSLDLNGNLIIQFNNGTYIEKSPIAWQETDKGRSPVKVAFQIIGDSKVGFILGEYIKGKPVIIDPTLSWNTFLGGSGDDLGYALTVDSIGNVYVCGYSSISWGSPVRSHFGSGNYDGFVAKLDNSGNLTWNTFLGGSGTDVVNDIKLDNNGNILICGYSTATWGSPVRSYTSGSDGYAAKLNSSGVLQWNTFQGGSSSDVEYAIGTDASGNIYLGGYSQTSWGSPIRSFSSGTDGTAVKLNSSGVLQWNTFLGTTSNDYIYSIAVTGSGDTYLAGISNSTWGSPVRSYSSGIDACVVKLNTSGTLQWNTFLGGTGSDYARYDIAIDGSSNIYISGNSLANWGSPVRAYTTGTGTGDAFVVKLNSSGSLQWNTFLGGSTDEAAYSLAINNSGEILVAGYSAGTWGSPEESYSSGIDCFAARLNNSGALQWNTFIGGSGDQYAYNVALDNSGNVYLSGYSNGTWGAPVRSFSGGTYDALVAKIGNIALPVELLYFKAKVKDGLGIINWATASEKDNHYFEVQISLDAKNFKTIGRINGFGNSNNIIKYAFTDSFMNPGTNYYRLKQTDYDGDFNYSDVVAVNRQISIAGFKNFIIYPNPASDRISIESLNVNEHECRVELTDIRGKKISENILEKEKTIECFFIPPGVYFINIYNIKHKIIHHEKILINP